MDRSPAAGRRPRSTSAAAALAAAWLAIAGGVVPLLGAQKAYSAEELLQPLLGPELAQWLQGPIARIATEQEIDRYLRLRSDDEARQFVASFWAARDPDPGVPGNPVLELYEKRAAEADKKWSEAAVAGRRTDRGTIHVLYGEPESLEYEEFRDVSGPDVELWRYPKKAPEGLDGRRPQRQYRFAKTGDLTRFYSPRDHLDPRRRDPSRPGFPDDAGEPFPSDPRLPGEP